MDNFLNVVYRGGFDYLLVSISETLLRDKYYFVHLYISKITLISFNRAYSK